MTSDSCAFLNGGVTVLGLVGGIARVSFKLSVAGSDIGAGVEPKGRPMRTRIVSSTLARDAASMDPPTCRRR